MEHEQKTSPGTKLRLIESAAAVFADHGYREATVAEICRRAEANIAAVNYHFGSKEGLYEAVWHHLLEIVDDHYPWPPAGSRPEETVAALIRQRVRAIFDKGKLGWLPRILHLQLANPAPETDRLVEKYLVPRMRRLTEAIGAMMDRDPDSFMVRNCALNIHSQIVMLNVCDHARRKLLGRDEATPEQVESITENLVTFSLGGIAALAEKGEHVAD